MTMAVPLTEIWRGIETGAIRPAAALA